MAVWSVEEINSLMLQLDNIKMPFEDYSFSVKNNAPVLLGKGGSAYVFEAYRRRDRRARGKYAVKVVGFLGDGDEKATTDMQRSAFWGEYFNVVSIYGYCSIDVFFDEEGNFARAERTDGSSKAGDGILNLKFVIMEKISPIINFSKTEGISIIPENLSKGDEKEVLKLAYDIANALSVMHKSDMIHRDLKLENIFYNSDQKRYKLGDFGIARTTESGFTHNDTGAGEGKAVGNYTVGYGAPEQINSDDEAMYDVTADIYALGIILYVLINNLKFPDSDGYRVNRELQYSKGYVVPKPQRCSDRFYDVIAKMCMYDPDDRYRSMEEVLADINRLLFKPAVSFAKEHKKSYAVAGASLLTAGLSLWNAVVPGNTLNPSVILILLIMLATAGGFLFKRPFLKTAYGVLLTVFIVINYMLGFRVPFTASVWVLLITAGFLHWSIGLSLVTGLTIARVTSYVMQAGNASEPGVMGALLLTAILLSGFMYIMYALSCQRDRQYSPLLIRAVPVIFIAAIIVFALLGDSMTLVYRNYYSSGIPISSLRDSWLASDSVLARLVAAGVNVWLSSVLTVFGTVIWLIRIKILTLKGRFKSS